MYDVGFVIDEPHIKFVLKWNMKRMLMELSLKSKMFLKSEMKEIEIHFVNWF